MKEISYEEVKRQQQQSSVEVAQKLMVETVGKKLHEARKILMGNKVPFLVIKPDEASVMDVVENRVKLHAKDDVVDRAELG